MTESTVALVTKDLLRQFLVSTEESVFSDEAEEWLPSMLDGGAIKVLVALSAATTPQRLQPPPRNHSYITLLLLLLVLLLLLLLDLWRLEDVWRMAFFQLEF